MKKQAKRILVTALAFSLIIPTLGASESEASAKTKLSKKTVSVKVGKKKKIKVKGIKKSKIKKTKWSVKSKKIAKLSKKKKNSVTIKGKKAGKTSLTAKIKVGSKTYKKKCKIKVKKSTGNSDTSTPSASATASPSTRNDSGNTATEAPATDESTATVEPLVNYSEGFESGDLGRWYARYDNEASSVTKMEITTESHSGNYAALLKDRVDDEGTIHNWYSAAIDFSEDITYGGVYEVSLWVKIADDSSTKKENFRLSSATKVDEDSDESYSNWPANVNQTVTRDEWYNIATTVTVPNAGCEFILYLETQKNCPDFVIDDIEITRTSAPAEYDASLTGLYSAYSDYFEYFGTATDYATLLNNNTLGFIKHHFNGITMGNQMKLDAMISSTETYLLDSEDAEDYVVDDDYATYEANQDESGNAIVPKIDFTTFDKVLKKAYENGLKVRIHSPLWHQQNPQCFFTNQFTTPGDDDTSQYVSEDVMLSRVDMYVKTLLNHALNSEYSSVIYAYDVVNEYTHMSNEASDHPNYWKYIFGETMDTNCSYVKKAYSSAYAELTDHDVTTDQIALIYNDYNTYDEPDTIIELINNINAKDDTYNPEGNQICTGIGMQCHINSTSTTPELLRDAIDKFATEGYEIQITEMDVTNCGIVDSSTSDEAKEKVWAAGAEAWEGYMTAILEAKQAGANIPCFVIWGTTDATSWRSTYSPLLFGTDVSDVKPAYYSLIELASTFGTTEG